MSTVVHPILAGDVETVRIKRTFSASPEAVFQAWTDPEEFMAWWQPAPYRTVAVEMDVRVGGEYRITMQHPSGSHQYLFGTYLSIDPSERLSMTWRLAGSEADDGYTAILNLEFRERDEGTELVLTHERLPKTSLDMYDAGWSDVLDRLARRLG
jgi:uncharacterized protein YndB with AHSA1/START domain